MEKLDQVQDQHQNNEDQLKQFLKLEDPGHSCLRIKENKYFEDLVNGAKKGHGAGLNIVLKKGEKQLQLDYEIQTTELKEMVSKWHDVFDTQCGGERKKIQDAINKIGSLSMYFTKESYYKKGQAVLQIFQFSIKKQQHYTIYQDSIMVDITPEDEESYIPGYLSFVEVEKYRELMSKLALNPDYEWFKPDLFVMDGSGFMHSKIFELASHFGVLYNVPTVTVSKQPQQVYFERDIMQKLKHAGAHAPLIMQNTTFGEALLPSCSNCEALFVQSGHRISLDSAISIVDILTFDQLMCKPLSLAKLFASTRSKQAQNKDLDQNQDQQKQQKRNNKWLRIQRRKQQQQIHQQNKDQKQELYKLLEEQPKFIAKYFEIENDALDPQQIEADAEVDPDVLAQFEYNISKDQYDQFDLGHNDKELYVKDNENLLIFIDVSKQNCNSLDYEHKESKDMLDGEGFQKLGEFIENLSLSLFDIEGESPIYQSVNICFFDNQIRCYEPKSRQEFQNMVNQEFKARQQRSKNSNFDQCNDIITNLELYKLKPQSFLNIVFITSGYGHTMENPNPSNQRYPDDLEQKLSRVKYYKNIRSKVSAFTPTDDLEGIDFLHQLSEAGSESWKFEEISKVSLQTDGDFLKVVKNLKDFKAIYKFDSELQKSQKPVISLFDIDKGYITWKECEQIFEFPEEEKKEVDPQDIGSSLIEEEPDQIIEQKDYSQDQTFFSVRYLMTILTKESVLKDRNLFAEIKFTEDLVTIQAKIDTMKVTEVPLELQFQAELDMIKEKVFKKVMLIQSDIGPDLTIDDKRNAFEQIKTLDRSLDAKNVEILKIKGNNLRKKLIGEIQEIKNLSQNIISFLRNNDLSHLGNDMIKKLNNLAYKNISDKKLNKLIDKRAITNESLYKRLEQEAVALIRTFDFGDLFTKNERVIKEVGQCPITTCNAIEAMQEGDCLAISLKISRCEGTIGDPSLLKIEQIIPTFISIDSFLQCAQMNLSQDNLAHGGFSKENLNPHLALGLGREDINGIMPLFLFREHWELCRKKMQPVFGFMCTLDVMGFSSEQSLTVPYLVLIKAEKDVKSDPTEINFKKRNLIKDTCKQMLSVKTFREELMGKIINFAYQKPNVSSRTTDKIKSIPVFLAQVYCLFEISNIKDKILTEEFKEYIKDNASISKLKSKVIRYALEEILRRSESTKELDDFTQKQILFPNHRNFVNQVWSIKSKDIESSIQCMQQSNDQPQLLPDTSYLASLFVDQSNEIKLQLGYIGTPREEVKNSYLQLKEESKVEEKVSEGNEVTKKPKGTTKGRKYIGEVDLNYHVIEMVKTEPWKYTNSSEKEKLIKAADKEIKQHRDFLFLANLMLENSYGKIEDILDFPEIKDCKEPRTKLLAILFQNSSHRKNSKRVKDIEAGNYEDIIKLKDAKMYLAKQLRRQVLGRLLYLETSLIQNLNSRDTIANSSGILYAVDMFQAAAMMREKDLFYGKGDFKMIVEMLSDQKRSPIECGYLDVANKLFLIKHGHIFSSEFFPSLYDPDAEIPDTSIDHTKVDQLSKIQLSKDKGQPQGGIMKKSVVRQLFKALCLIHKVVGVNQMQMIFPEYQECITIWDLEASGDGYLRKEANQLRRKRAKDKRTEKMKVGAVKKKKVYM